MSKQKKCVYSTTTKILELYSLLQNNKKKFQNEKVVRVQGFFLLIWCWWIIGKRSLNWLYSVIQQNLITQRRIVIHWGSSAISIREQSSSNGGLTSIAQSFSPNGRLPVYSRTSLILYPALERHLNQMRWKAASLQMVLSKW